MKPLVIVSQFDAYLASRALRLDAVVIGGAALVLLGVIDRQTKDCDVLHPRLPEDVAEAAREFAASLRAAGEALDDGWLNNGPASLVPLLPPGWQDRLQVAFEGEALLLRTLGRAELLRSKLFALCDRGIDLGDCLALAPSPTELAEALPWVEYQDANPDWPRHVQEVLADLGRKLSHGS